MYNEFPICEEKAIALDLPGRIRDLKAFLIWKFGQIVYEFPGVGTSWDHKAELKVVGADYSAPEIVSLYHGHLINGFRSIGESEGQPDSS